MRIRDVAIYYIPIDAQTPLTFGSFQIDSMFVLRVSVTVGTGITGASTGWGEVPLNVHWAWPDASLPTEEKLEQLRRFSTKLGRGLTGETISSDPLTVYFESIQPRCRNYETIPEAARRLVAAAFDIAVYDLFGTVRHIATFPALSSRYLERDLSYRVDDEALRRHLSGVWPVHVQDRPKGTLLPVWHLVGVRDSPDELIRWIESGRLNRLKIKLRGTDPESAVARFFEIVRRTSSRGIRRFSVDFNGTLATPLPGTIPPTLDHLLFVPDESVMSWRDVVAAREARYDGIVVKTAKGITEMIVSIAVAQALRMRTMVQDLTNPMLAMIVHAAFGYYFGGPWGIEANAVQYFPFASEFEERIHPGLFSRRDGSINVSSLRGPGIGYRIDEIRRILPRRAA